jgi:hypothetical protein
MDSTAASRSSNSAGVTSFPPPRDVRRRATIPVHAITAARPVGAVEQRGGKRHSFSVWGDGRTGSVELCDLQWSRINRDAAKLRLEVPNSCVTIIARAGCAVNAFVGRQNRPGLTASGKPVTLTAGTIFDVLEDTLGEIHVDVSSPVVGIQGVQGTLSLAPQRTWQIPEMLSSPGLMALLGRAGQWVYCFTVLLSGGVQECPPERNSHFRMIQLGVRVCPAPVIAMVRGPLLAHPHWIRYNGCQTCGPVSRRGIS